MKKNCRYGKNIQFIICDLRFIKSWITFCFLLAVLLSSCKEEKPETKNHKPKIENQKSEIYYCPMHPEVQQNEPGICEKCNGMKLVLKNSENYLDAVLQPVSSVVLSNVKIINPQYKSFSLTVEALGTIEYDDREKNNISSIYSGRIEKLYIRNNYQIVKNGDKILEIYSPEMVTAQENFIYLLNTSPNEKELIEAARQKLLLLQLTNEQIKEIEETKKIKNSFSVYSNYEGHIHEMLDSKMQIQEMSDYQSSPILSVKEGMYVENGEVLFNVVNTHRVIAILSIKSSDISKIYKGQKVKINFNNNFNSQIDGNVDFIEPIFNKNSKTMKVRVNILNKDHELKVGSLVKAKIVCDSLETLYVPASSVMDLGKSKIVWIWKEGMFNAKKIETGTTYMNWVEIADGLIENDQIALEAHYLTDSEGFVKVNENE